MNRNLKELAKIATPIDPSTMRIDTFFLIIEKNEYLQVEYEKLVDDEFCNKIQEKGIHFILNYDKYKKIFNRLDGPMLKIEYCGREMLPTIVISNL